MGTKAKNNRLKFISTIGGLVGLVLSKIKYVSEIERVAVNTNNPGIETEKHRA